MEIMKQREVKQEILLRARTQKHLVVEIIRKEISIATYQSLLNNLYLARWNATDSQIIALLFISQ
jgi:hypothetical protein